MVGSFQCVGERGGVRPACPVHAAAVGSYWFLVAGLASFEECSGWDCMAATKWPQHMRGRARLLCYAAHVQASIYEAMAKLVLQLLPAAPAGGRCVVWSC